MLAEIGFFLIEIGISLGPSPPTTPLLNSTQVESKRF
jgi:hypothetical protein